MKQEQWNTLLAVVNGELLDPVPVGFIIDSPWLPNWAGMSILDYFTNESMWFEANMQAIERFPDILFLPGFWSEYGMCTEPSAFGAKGIFPENEFPFAEKVLDDISNVASSVAHRGGWACHTVRRGARPPEYRGIPIGQYGIPSSA